MVDCLLHVWLQNSLDYWSYFGRKQSQTSPILQFFSMDCKSRKDLFRNLWRADTRLGVQSSAFFLSIKTGFFPGSVCPKLPKITWNCLKLPEIAWKLPEIAWSRLKIAWNRLKSPEIAWKLPERGPLIAWKLPKITWKGPISLHQKGWAFAHLN